MLEIQFQCSVLESASLLGEFPVFRYMYSPNPKRLYIFNTMSFSIYILRVEIQIK